MFSIIKKKPQEHVKTPSEWVLKLLAKAGANIWQLLNQLFSTVWGKHPSAFPLTSAISHNAYFSWFLIPFHFLSFY